MCWYWGNSGLRPKSEELGTDDIKALIGQLRGDGNSLCVSGGEPLTRKDIIGIMAYAQQNKVRTEILTNGTLVRRDMVRDLVAVSDNLVFSIDGPPSIHDSIRGEGAFDEVLHGINLVAQAKDAIQKAVPLRINLTISSINVHHLEEVVDLAADLGCTLSFGHLMFSDLETTRHQTKFVKGALHIEDKTIGGFVNHLHEIDANVLVDKLHAVESRAKRLRVPFHTSPPLRNDLEIRTWYHDLDLIPSLQCIFPWTTMYIKPDGDVQPCEFITYSYGNVGKQPVHEIWNNARAKEFRRTLRKSLFPGCVRCCKLTPKPLLKNTPSVFSEK